MINTYKWFYRNKIWSKDKFITLLENGYLTKDQYKEITGEDYS